VRPPADRLDQLARPRRVPPRARPPAAGAGRGRRFAALAVALAAALALAAPALLPFLELANESNRAAPTLGFAGGAALEWWHWASLAVPDGGRHAFYWEFHLYVGALALVAGLAGLTLVREPGVRGLAVAGLAGALVAMGPATPVFALLYHVVPGLAGFHIHSRAAVLPCVALLFAGARFLSLPSRRRSALVALASAAVAALAGVGWASARLPPAPARPALVQAALVALAAGVCGAAVAGRPALARAAAMALPVLVAADLVAAHQAARTAWAAPAPSFLGSEPALARSLARALPPSPAPTRVLVPPDVARENAAPAYGWASVGGYNALTLDRVWRYLHDRLGVPVPEGENTYVAPAVYERGPFAYAEAALAVGWDPRAGAVAFRRDADPRVYLATSVRRVLHWSEAAPRMAAGHDVHEEALVEEDGLLPAEGAPGTAGPSRGRVELTEFAPERLVIRVESDRPALLVVKEAWYPGWRATVGGRPARCVPANGWMRAVPVEAGAHDVVLTYRSRRLAAGALVFVLAAAALAAATVRERRIPVKDDAPRAAGADRLPLP
jgi:hypothetical protein